MELELTPIGMPALKTVAFTRYAISPAPAYQILKFIAKIKVLDMKCAMNGKTVASHYMMMSPRGSLQKVHEKCIVEENYTWI